DDENYETETINFIGYTNKMKQYGKFKGIYKLSPDELSKELNKKHGNLIRKDKYNIMLAHNPVYLREYASYNADLVLSGHLHGGIVRLPFIGGIMSPQTFFSRRYSAGLYKEGSCHMYVSRGLGVHTIPLRLFNRPELAFITIKRRDS
ncbi:MAG: metallophosphoesterase, partial [Lachnospiraceae bacterium]|nr:metallophosphoesterase [Lachnospiraceae bacterium]